MGSKDVQRVSRKSMEGSCIMDILFLVIGIMALFYIMNPWSLK